jgi:uncharacterized protein (DUF302 family)
MKLPLLLSLGLLAGSALAQSPQAPQSPQVTPEQAQAMMARQMQMMAAMFDYRRSKLGFDETVSAISVAADRQGWQKPTVQDVQADMAKSGVAASRRMKVLETCPSGFNDRLAKAGQGKLPPHPCRFTVFEARDGKTYVVRMNSALISRGLTGEAAKLMAFIGGDEETILKGIAE